MRVSILGILFLVLLLGGCSNSPIAVSHATGTGSITVEIGGEPVTINLDAIVLKEGGICQHYDIEYDGFEVIGYAPNSDEKCGHEEEFRFDWIRLVNPILRIITRFF